jgi:plastocyanin
MAIRSTRLRETPPLLLLACAAVLTAACGSASPNAAPPSAASPNAAPSSAVPVASNSAPRTITVTMTEFTFALDHPPTTPGSYVFHAVNAGKFPHAVELDGAGLEDQKSSVVQPGGATDLALTLQAGNLDMYCPIDGHRARGMETHFVIAAAGAGG